MQVHLMRNGDCTKIEMPVVPREGEMVVLEGENYYASKPAYYLGSNPQGRNLHHVTVELWAMQ